VSSRRCGPRRHIDCSHRNSIARVRDLVATASMRPMQALKGTLDRYGGRPGSVAGPPVAVGTRRHGDPEVAASAATPSRTPRMTSVNQCAA
jgi:hypothetical protein